MPAFYYSISAKSDSQGESEIKLRIYVFKNRVFRVGSGVRVNKDRWTKRNTIQIPDVEGEERDRLVAKKQLLKELIIRLEQAIRANDKTKIDKGWLIGFITCFHFERRIQTGQFVALSKALPPQIRSFKLLPLIEDFVLEKKISGTELGHFTTLQRSLRRYELYKQVTNKKSSVLYLNKITTSDLDDIQKFLTKEKEICIKYPKIYKQIPYYARSNKSLTGNLKAIDINPKERGLNFVTKLMAALRRFVTWALDKKNLKNNPFDRFLIAGPVYGTPIYLTLNERDQLYDADLSSTPEIEIQRDIFIFQCSIGCRVGDLIKLKKSNVVNDVLTYVANKTRNDNPLTIEVPFTDQAREIVKKYENYEGELLLPFVEMYKYNYAIKRAFKLAGINRTIMVLDPQTRAGVPKRLDEIASSHMARRTFIGNLYKYVKDPELVSVFSGHKNGSKAFYRYRDIDSEMKEEVIQILNENQK